MTNRQLKLYIKSLEGTIKEINETSTLSRKTPQSYYNDAIFYMLKARDSLQRSQFANLASYSTASRMFDDQYGFSYSAFICSSYEHNIAYAFLSLAMCHYKLSSRDNKDIVIEDKAISSYMYSIDDCMDKLFPAGMSQHGCQISISQLNYFCNDRNINLKFYVYMLTENIILFNSIELNHNNEITQKFASSQEKPK